MSLRCHRTTHCWIRVLDMISANIFKGKNTSCQIKPKGLWKTRRVPFNSGVTGSTPWISRQASFLQILKQLNTHTHTHSVTLPPAPEQVSKLRLDKPSQEWLTPSPGHHLVPATPNKRITGGYFVTATGQTNLETSAVFSKAHSTCLGQQEAGVKNIPM